MSVLGLKLVEKKLLHDLPMLGKEIPLFEMLESYKIERRFYSGPLKLSFGSIHDESQVAIFSSGHEGWIEISQRFSGNLEDAACTAYQNLFSTVTKFRLGRAIRIWQTLPKINVEEPVKESVLLERYRQFNLGRRRGWSGPTPYPAASCIGDHCESDRIHLVALTSFDFCEALENPRQIPAFRYSQAFGPTTPLFSRGMLHFGEMGPEVFISGTASVVGEESVHLENIEEQVHEALRNIRALLDQQRLVDLGVEFARGLESLSNVRVYVRRSSDFLIVRKILEEAGVPRSETLLVQADICRADLLVEIEATARYY